MEYLTQHVRWREKKSSKGNTPSSRHQDRVQLWSLLSQKGLREKKGSSGGEEDMRRNEKL